MPKRHQQRPAKIAAGHNHPQKSTVITTGTYKKHETYQAQAARHENPNVQPQEAKVPPSRDMSMGRTHRAESQERIQDKESRSGTDSNARNPRKSSEVHKSDKTKREPHQHGINQAAVYNHDLAVGHRSSDDEGLGAPTIIGEGFSANDFKDLHTILADLTDDELKRIEIMPTGTRLIQGSKYIDLSHLENGEFVASGDMVAEPGHYYVLKQDSDYILWNRLNQVTNPARLDESETQTE
ncbi:hypothetical protein [Reticulibacter mediterranei]|nr:hypothetical protein [Reticulibacter mediterranei]